MGPMTSTPAANRQVHPSEHDRSDVVSRVGLGALVADGTRLLPRRRMLALLGLGGAGVLAACSRTEASVGNPTTSTAGTTIGSSVASSGAAAASESTPGETGGPFPSDGSNDNGAGTMADVLHDPRVVRSDIRADLDGSNVQQGVPLTLTVQVVQQGSGNPLAGHAVYIWHCNIDGVYSGYASGMLASDTSARSFLRGVQVADADGRCTFGTVLPGRYRGRAFHIHMEVFGDTSLADKVLTSQMAIDDDLIDALYAEADGYSAALAADTDNADDGVFADGVEHQLLAVSGDAATGLTATFSVVV